jgi:hypothetical protein
MTMLERIARAMCEADGLDPDADCRDCGGITLSVALEHPENWRTYVRKAIAAVKAMREIEPADAEDAAMECGCSPGEFTEGWRKMIDCILADKEDRA